LIDAIDTVFLVCVFVFTAVAAVWDHWTKKLPNALTVSGLAAAVIYHVVAGALEAGITGVGHRLLFSAGGFATGFGILFILWAIGGGGGGDVKYMGALGAWLGPKTTFEVLVVAALVAGVLSFGVFVWEYFRLGPGGAKRRYVSRSEEKSRSSKKVSKEEARQQRMVRRRLMPFGLPAAIATWIVLAYNMSS